MKKYLLIVTLLLCFFAKKSLAQTNRVHDSIKALNLDHYATLPVDSFLHKIPQSYDYIKIIGNLKNDRALGLCIYYPNNLNIWIQPLHYVFMNQVDPNRIWNLSLFKKETAHHILVIAAETSLWGQE